MFRLVIMSIVLISLALALIPHIIYIILKFGAWIANSLSMPNTPFHLYYKPFGITALGLIVVWVLLFLWGNVFGRYRHEVKEVELSFDTLPTAFEDYRIVQISDLHLDGWEDHAGQLSEIVDNINALNPDLIVFTGDLVSLSQDELVPLIPVLKKLKAKDGIISVMGNHDYMPYDRGLSQKQRNANIAQLQRMEREQLGWNLLLNEHAVITHDSDSIAIIGCENQSMGVHNIIARGKLKQAMEGTEGMFRILLTHDPTHWRGEVVPETDIPLTLSGHTHAAQFRVFGFSFARFIYKEYDGLYEEGNQKLYVNIGLGGTMPMRIGATPEITVIRVRG